MSSLPASLKHHRVTASDLRSVNEGVVVWEPVRSLWFSGMTLATLIGGPLSFSVPAFAIFVISTGAVLLLGHSVGMHRKLIHRSFECPQWLEYVLVYCGCLVGLSGPLGLIRSHELRDYAQRLPSCHDFLAHRRGPWRDAWWQLHCELKLDRPPQIRIEPSIADDPVYRILQGSWMAQQIPWAILLFCLGGWGFVVWGVCARVTAGVFGHWIIGHLAHNRGELHHEVVGAAVQGRNVRFVSLLTMGENWHNNHHAFPGSARLGLHAGEWDPGWWLLCGLGRLGLARDFRLPQAMPPRPELRTLRPANTAALQFNATRLPIATSQP